MSKKHGNWVRGMVSGLSPDIGKVAEATAEVLDQLGPEHDRRCENYILELSGIITGRHFNEEASRIVIGRMEANELVLSDGTPWRDSVGDYMQAMGLTAEVAGKEVHEAYDRQALKAKESGIAFPSLPDGVTDHDCLVLLARAFSTYWFTVAGNVKTASDVAVADLTRRGGSWGDIWEMLTD